MGLELADPGFDFSVLCQFRTRLIAGEAEMQLLEVLSRPVPPVGIAERAGKAADGFDSCAGLGTGIRPFGTRVGETLRAALNKIASIEPEWLHCVAPKAWYERYSRHVEESRLPQTDQKRESYAQAVGEDGFALLDLVEAAEAPAKLRHLQQVAVLRTVWARHYTREASTADGSSCVRFKTHHVNDRHGR